MDLITVMSDLCDDKKYRFHLAKKEPGGVRPIDVLARSDDEWLNWQVYRGRGKERFTVDNIVSFAQISGSRFLFGGVFKITGRESVKYKVEYTKKYADLIGRLILDYSGNNTRQTVFTPSYIFENSKIAGIYEHRFRGEPFVSFEEINHDFDSIETIIKNSLPDWKSALSCVYGVYLISDEKTGKHYVGSACGGEGVWGRWRSYVNNYHGSNKDLVELFNNKSETYFRDNFKYSILEVIPASATKDDVLKKEALWKRKLFSRKHGYNRN